ncbi:MULTISPECIES: SigE family RNA polymerase sigma factor [Streptomyces]|uniref:RNA polymerase sigma-70 factor, sigma-E family n=1 Tax=Streptomyces yunnanensis TaxID=156453 RepID=A0A9X8MZ30_9ACTN|nr:MULTISPECIES: SigE family RNA polymerase sigma factor [Streptomyces]SHM37265.1 RNA polymerase sigma-70 factor, sigma-E family [Streptomyces yunnanensis]
MKNTLHGTASGAVVTRLHDIGREKSGADGGTSLPERSRGSGGGRGCARGTGRQRPPYMVAIDTMVVPKGPNGGNGGQESTDGGVEYRETGDRRTATEAAEAEAAFTAYVQERRASLYATAYHLTGDRYEAEDLLQSALFSTYRAWDRISDKAALGGYLRRTMTNLHISAWRRRRLNEYPTEELPETAADADAMRGTELRAVLWQALARLPETQRTMLVLRYYEGRTDPEIADILNISVGTVKSSIWRSLRRLREDEVLSFGRDEEESFGALVA